MGLCKKIQEIKPFIVMEVLEAAQELEARGYDVIHLEVGEPDFETPDCVKEAAKRAIDEGKTKYTHSLGIRELREAICDDYKKNYNVDLDPDQIIITSGTSPGMLLCFGALLDPGEEVIVSDPGYACYETFIKFADGIPKRVKVFEDDGFQYEISDIKKVLTKNTKAILINSPANPTGTLLSKEKMQQLADLGVYIVSDEIYHGLVYEGEEHSILEFTDRAFVLNGFSKKYAMTGWRLGYLIAPKDFVRCIQSLAQNLFICASSVAQYAAIAALKQAEDDVNRMRKIYDERRKYMIKRLKDIGFKIAVEPTGAFYILANAKKFTDNSYKFAFDILKNAHVGVTPGIDFGENGEGFIRFSYANSIENIEKGMDRIESYLKG
jgi:aspartate/methionine/tyrosine aminotransferase